MSGSLNQYFSSCDFVYEQDPHLSFDAFLGREFPTGDILRSCCIDSVCSLCFDTLNKECWWDMRQNSLSLHSYFDFEMLAVVKREREKGEKEEKVEGVN